MKKIIKEQVQAQVSKIMQKMEKYVTESLKSEVLVRSTNQPQTSYAVAASLSEFELKKIILDKIEENKSINRSDIQKNIFNALVESYNSDKDILTSYGDVVTLKRGRDDQDKDEDPFAGSNQGSKRRRSGKEAESSKEPKHKESKSTKEHGQKVDDLEDQSYQEFNTGNDDVTPVRGAQDDDIGTQSSFNEFLATPIDFSTFMLNLLKIDNLNSRSGLTDPTYVLIKCTTNIVVEQEYTLKEVFRGYARIRLDWHNPKGSKPHGSSKPLPVNSE
ncbi:hypothetical protein Tco_0451707 [Tanacetum coccineum]